MLEVYKGANDNKPAESVDLILEVRLERLAHKKEDEHTVQLRTARLFAVLKGGQTQEPVSRVMCLVDLQQCVDGT